MLGNTAVVLRREVLLHPPPPRDSRVLVVRSDSAGDVLLAGPAVRAVAASAEVVFLCGPRGESAARLLPGIQEVVVQHVPWIDMDPRPIDNGEILAFVRAVADADLREALILTSYHQSPLPMALLLRMAGIERIGAISPDYPGTLLDVRHTVDDDIHEVERAISLAAAMGHELPPGDDGRLIAEFEEAPLGDGLDGGDYVVVHPAAAVPARTWAPERWALLVESLVLAGERVVVTGAPDERLLTRYVSRHGPGAVDLGGQTSFAQLAAILANARALVVGNTGPAHLAAAVGCPVVSLYAPTVPSVRWRPWMVPNVLLGEEVPCAGCRARVCPVPGHPCIGSIPVDRVVEAIRSVTRQALHA